MDNTHTNTNTNTKVQTETDILHHIDTDTSLIIMRMSTCGEITYLSNATHNMFGYTPEELIQKNKKDNHIHPEDRKNVKALPLVSIHMTVRNRFEIITRIINVLNIKVLTKK